MRYVSKVLMALAAPTIAVIVAMLVTSGVVAFVGADPVDFWRVMLSWPEDRPMVNLINQASMIFVAATAAAIGFRMNLFNIGVEGQYRMASYVAAVVAGASLAPGKLNLIVAIAAAMATGAIWAALPAILKVSRGVSEVISTIMLNAVAVFLVGYLLNNYGDKAGNGRRTTPIEDGSLVGGWKPFGDAAGALWGLGLIAVVVGVTYWFVINKTRFGFDLRATGMSETAAVASGVNIKRMTVTAMLLSGAVAGLIWLPALFDTAASSHEFSTSAFQTQLGFTGIAVALLGRNSVSGMALGATLFAFLSVQATRLEFAGVDVSNDVVIVTQGVVVLAIVIAYEVVGRWRQAQDQQRVRESLAAGAAA